MPPSLAFMRAFGLPWFTAEFSELKPHTTKSFVLPSWPGAVSVAFACSGPPMVTRRENMRCELQMAECR